jgi:hypothetical protein
LRRWGEQIGRFARPNILFYDERVFDLYHRICAQYRMGEDTEERKVAQRSGRTTSATKNVARDPFCSRPLSREAIGKKGFLLGGRTRARTWDPLIKRHAVTIDISSEFSQLS